MDENRNYSINNNQGNQNPIYPTPQLKEEPKKKKSYFVKFIKFTVVALAFGLIAGAGASGYHYFFQGGRDNNDTNIIVEDTSQLEEDDLIELSDEKTVLYANTKTEGIITDVSDIVEKVIPSIVSINSTDILTQYDMFFGREFNKPVVGAGSGIIIGQSDNSLLIVTNNHVVENAEEIEVVFVDDSKVKATIKGADSGSDLAVLEIDIDEISKDTQNAIKVARLGDSDMLKAGEMVIAIGNALGYGQSVTVGYVSALDREIVNQGISMNLLQTDAAINPGNSGGALLNTSGEVIGINSMKFADTTVEGMGYAIPISDAIPMINLLMSNQVLEVNEMGFLGINVETAQNVTADLSYQFSMPIGIYINEIVEDSPATIAGLKPGHIIYGFNNLSVETIDELVKMLSYSRPGEEVSIKIKELQDGEYVEKELKAILSERP